MKADTQEQPTTSSTLSDQQLKEAISMGYRLAELDAIWKIQAMTRRALAAQQKPPTTQG